MKEIRLTKGKVALVDDADYEWLNQWRWYYHNQGYAARRESQVNNVQGKMIMMHRQIANPVAGQIVDHCDLNGLNNQRSNLRVCTYPQNGHNRNRPAKNRTSQYKGVSYIKRRGKWRAYIVIAKGKQKHLGTFADESAAARAYDVAALVHFGEFARLNFQEA